MKTTYVILIDAVLPDPSSGYSLYPTENRNDEYFNGPESYMFQSRKRLTTGVSLLMILFQKKKISINILI
jgi:hypothetical protein